MASQNADEGVVVAAAAAALHVDADADASPPPPPPTETDATLQQRLAALAADPSALCDEVTRIADTSDEQELETVLRFLQHDTAPLVAEQVAVGLIAAVDAAFAVQDSASDSTLVLLLLLDQLLTTIKQRGVAGEKGSEESHPTDTLFAFFRLATRRLSAEPLEEQERVLFLQWCDSVLEIVYAASPSENDSSRQPHRTAHDGDQRSWVLSVASMLLALHDAIAQRAVTPTAVSFKVATLVWKNLTKMSSQFGHVLATSASDSSATSSASTTSNTFQVDDMLASVIASLEQCAAQLCDESLSDAAVTATLKFLRLYWRAFQGQLLCYLSVLTSEVESSVMALVNVAASLTQLSQAPHAHNIPKKIQAEAARLLHMALALAEKLGSGANTGSKVAAAAHEQVRVLLWHSDDEMVRAITQRRQGDPPAPPSEHGQRSQQLIESSIRIGHLLAVAAFGSADDNVLPAKDTSEEVGGAKILAASAMLLERYQMCAVNVPLKALSESRELFLDSLLNLLLRVDDVEVLQLFLIKQLLHPDPSRRLLLWDVWREFMCFGWDEERAGAVLTTLLVLAQCEGGGSASAPSCLAPGVQLEVYELIAFLYPDMADSLKRICIDGASEIVDAIFSEGPSHQFSLRVASQLCFVEKLSSASFLKQFDHPDKEEWIAKYLPMCFECCGTVLDLLNAGSELTHDEKLGMMRILDVCLLVVKAVLDDNHVQGPDLDGLAGMLVPMSSEILTQLGKIVVPRNTATGLGRSRKAPTILDFKLSREASRTLPRILETCTHVLGKLGGLLKRNQSNQFVLALRDLSQVIEQAQPLEASGVAATTAWFAKSTLGDVQVGESDMEVAWQLFTRLFRNLSCVPPAAKHGEKRGAVLPPHVSTAFSAFHQFLSHSNVAGYRHPSLSVPKMLHESSRALFSEFLSLQQLSKADATAVASSHRVQARSRHQRLFCERFPDEKRADGGDVATVQGGLKRDRESSATDAAPDEVSTGEESSQDVQPSRKRQKLAAFVSMCKRAHQVLSSTEQSASAGLLRAVTEQELDDATRVLEQLLAKAYCS